MFAIGVASPRLPFPSAQLGITFADDSGELAEGCPTFQFNFRFNLQCVAAARGAAGRLSHRNLAPRCPRREDMYAQDSIDLLARSGIDFASHEERGIDIDVFGEALMSSGETIRHTHTPR